MPDWNSLIFPLSLLALLVLLLLYLGLVWDVTVREHQRALLFHHGKFQRLLEPGRYRLNRRVHQVQLLDMRAQLVTITGQEVLSADNISLRVSLAATYRIGDPYRAFHATANYQEALYSALQLQLRDLIGARPIDELLANRREVGDTLLEAVRPKAVELGLELLSAGIKDIMFPGELKQVFAQVVNARNEGLALLERARGESAALRNLANTARLMENNPMLLQLRLLQTLHRGSGNTIILKMADGDDTAAVARAPGAAPGETPS